MAMATQMLSANGLQTRIHRGSFGGTQLRPVAVPSLRRARRVAAQATQTDYPSNWLNKNPIVPVLGFLGWTLPTNIPVPVLGGKSFFGEFLGSIGYHLAHFPTPPAITDKFWLYLIVYHVGLFTTLLLGQIGVNGRKGGYW